MNDGREEAFNLLNQTCKTLSDKVADNAHLYFFCSWKVFSDFERIISKYFEVKTPIIWDKKQFGSGDLYNDWGNQTEIIIYACRGKKTVNRRCGNVLSISKVDSYKMLHPTQKNIELLKQILAVSHIPGDFVVDPFMGSGSTIMACNEMKIDCLGVELDEEMFKIAAQRLG